MFREAFGNRERERESLDLGTKGFGNRHLSAMCVEMRLKSLKCEKGV